MTVPSPVITIDGPTASGKGTVAHRVAKHLGFHYLDSGALYRLTALMATRHGIALEDETAIASMARTLPCRFVHGHVFLEDADVTDAVRAEEVVWLLPALPFCQQYARRWLICTESAARLLTVSCSSATDFPPRFPSMSGS